MPHRLACLLLLSPFLIGTFGCVSASPVDPAALEQALLSGKRPAADVARDAGRRPAEVVAFLGIAPGMTVIDLVAASGYYTEVLSIAVGREGKVYAQNSPFVLKMRDGANDKALTQRLAGGRLPNVERLDRGMDAVGLEPGSVDAAITALNFHDIYNGRGADAANDFLLAVRNVLEPGGVLGIIDHRGIAGQDNAKLHRIEEQLVVDATERAGFEFEASSDVLRFPEDDHTQNVFSQAMRGKTDRFVLRLRKPVD